MKKSQFESLIREVIRETIRKVDGKYVVYPEKGGKRLGTHSTKKAAEKQLTAIHLNKEAVEPNFDFEWEEASRYPEFKKLGKDKWIELAKTGKAIEITSAKDINNTDANEPDAFKTLNPDKQKRALAQLKSGNVEMPIVALYSDGYKELIGGNTRLTAMMAQNKKATIWQFEVPEEIEENYADGKVNESGYEEAWELLGQPVPEIKNFVKQLGLKNDDATAKKVGAIIDSIKDSFLPANKIPGLKNLANKGNDTKILKAVQQISGKPDAEQQYTKLMQARDAGEKRNRGYDVSGLIKAVKTGNYESPVLLQLPSGLYVIGGRTRLYAALALGVKAKVKIITSDTFKQVKENYADGKVKGKSRPGRVKKAGASCKGSVTDLRAKAKKYGGEKGKMYHWCANMKGGKK